MRETPLVAIAVLFALSMLAAPTTAVLSPGEERADVPAEPPDPPEGELDLDLVSGPKGTLYLLSSWNSTDEGTQEGEDEDDEEAEILGRPLLWVGRSGVDSLTPVSPALGPEDGPKETVDPEAAFAVAGDGTAFLAQRDADRIEVLASSDRGRSWSLAQAYPPAPEERVREFSLVAGQRQAVLADAWRQIASNVGNVSPSDPDPDLEIGWLDRVRLRAVGGVLDDPTEDAATFAPGGWARVEPITMAPNGTVFSAQAHASEGVVVFRGSLDGTERSPFRERPVVDPAPGLGATAPALGLTDEGTLLLAWTEHDPTRARVYLAASRDGGATWSDPTPVGPSAVCLHDPALATHASSTYLAYRPGACSRPAEPRLFRVSDDGGSLRVEPATYQRAANLDARPCPERIACDETPEDGALDLTMTADGRPLMAWRSEGWSLVIATGSSAVGDEEVAPDQASTTPSSQAPPGWAVPAALATGVALLAGLALLLRQRWRWILAGLFSRIRDDEVLDHPVRQEIHEVVEDRPGIHFRALGRVVGLSPGNLEHHLRKLERAGLLRAHKTNGHRCLFVPGTVDPAVEQALVEIKSRGAKTVVDELVREPARGVRALARRAGLAASTVSHHLDRLEEGGLVERRIEGRRTTVSLTELGERVAALIV